MTKICASSKLTSVELPAVLALPVGNSAWEIGLKYGERLVSVEILKRGKICEFFMQNCC
jgi:hypothetical protein